MKMRRKKKEKLEKASTLKSDIFAIKNVAVIGAGAFGTSIARTICEKRPDINLKLWAYEKELPETINTYHINNLYLSDVVLPNNIVAVHNLTEAVRDAQVVIFATPSKVLYDISQRIKKVIQRNTYIGYLTKGFCRVHNKILPMSKALANVFPSHKNLIVAVYGPSHAEEVSKDFHTCLNVASVSGKSRKVFVDLLSCEYISCLETDDIVGVDLGTTLKNPAAIAAGILSVMPKCGDNLTGALISEALNEMIRFAKVFNAREETIIGIAGLGDLVATALSEHSRNRRFGRDIANQILSSGISFNLLDRLIMIIKPDYGFEKMSEKFNYLAEGIYVIEPILELAEKYKISMPVYKSLYEVLLNKKDPKLLIETVKNPGKFDQMVGETKIYVTEKKRGLEKKRGGIFKKPILKRSVSNILNNPAFESELVNFRNAFLKSYEENKNLKKNDPDFSQKEYDLFRKINFNNIDKELSHICKLYIEDISDNFNYLAYKIIIKIIKIINFFYILLIKSHSEKVLENNIKLSGNYNKLKKINNTSNVVYVSTYRSYLDFAYINMAVDRYGLYIPRFFIERKVLKSKIKKYFLNLMGAYCIDSEKLVNPIYREVAQNYLATLIEHGIQILFFPEVHLSKNGAIGEINKEFLSTIMNALYKNTEEIALIPIEVSYYKKPEGVYYNGSNNEVSIKRILDNRIKINFSDPIFVSEFSNSENMVSMLSENIDKKWRSDSHIFPHYILCKIIKDNNYQLNLDKAYELVLESLRKYNIKKYKTKNVLKKGVVFILKNNMGTINDKELLIFNKEEIDYYSNLIYN